MAKKSDTSEAASQIEHMQRRRLRALRRLVTDYQIDAAEAAGVSDHSWGRMERGPTKVDAVALARFCAAYGLPAGFVITGSMAGLDDPAQIMRLMQLTKEEEAADASALVARTGAQPGRPRADTPKRAGMTRRRATAE